MSNRNPHQKLTGRFVQIRDQRPVGEGRSYVDGTFLSNTGLELRAAGHIEDEHLGGEVRLYGEMGSGAKSPVFVFRTAWPGPFPEGGVPGSDDVRRLLASSLVSVGVGPARAEAFREAFGEDAWEVLKNDPGKAAQALGNEKVARDLHQALGALGWDRVHVLAELIGLGLTPKKAELAVDRFGADAVERVRRNPYALAEVQGVGFLTADQIARETFNIPPDDARRQVAVVRETLVEAAKSGHTGRSRARLLKGIRRQLEARGAGSGAEVALEEALRSGVVKVRSMDDGDELIQLGGFREREDDTAYLIGRSLGRRGLADPTEVRRTLTLPTYRDLSPEQKASLLLMFSRPLSTLSGPPGTGKTVVAKAAVQLGEDLGVPVTVVASTGIAGQVLESRIQEEGLDVRADTLDSLVGRRSRAKPIPDGLVLVDEFPMVSLDLLHRLMQGVDRKDGRTAVCLVGDPTQLESVPPGAVARDLTESIHVPGIQLQESYRCDRKSYSALAGEAIVRGQPPRMVGEKLGPADSRTLEAMGVPKEASLKEDLWWLESKDDEHIITLLERSVQRWEARGVDPREILVLAPVHRGTLGTANVNRVLQALWNPEGEEMVDGSGDPLLDAEGNALRAGDRVLLHASEKRGGMINGMGGMLVGHGVGGSLQVRFDGSDEMTAVTGRARSSLTLGYCRTVHKAQGSEADVTMLLLRVGGHYPVLERRLLRVALSRHRTAFVGIGERRALAMGVRNSDPRETGLKQAIHEQVLLGVADRRIKSPVRGVGPQTGFLPHLAPRP